MSAIEDKILPGHPLPPKAVELGKVSLDDLYFGVAVSQLSFSTFEEGRRLQVINLFALCRVKYSVARWVLMDKEERAAHDFLWWCFGDVSSRVEYEFVVSPMVGDSRTKVDTFDLYVRPNALLLEAMVNKVTKTSAQRYVKQWRAERRKYVKK